MLQSMLSGSSIYSDTILEAQSHNLSSGLESLNMDNMSIVSICIDTNDSGLSSNLTILNSSSQPNFAFENTNSYGLQNIHTKTRILLTITY